MPQTNDRNPGDGDRSVGAYSVGEKKKRAGWLLPLLGLLALVAVGLALWGVLRDRNGNDTPQAATAASPSTTTSAPTAGSPSPSGTATPAATGTSPAGTSPTVAAGSPGAGRLVAGGQSLLPLTGTAAIGEYTGQPATATGVRVQSVPADEGFWLGDSSTDRVWVQLTGPAGETAYKVKTGDRVDFTAGRVVANPAGYAVTVGLTAAEGAAQLTAQRHHISVPKNALRLSS